MPRISARVVCTLRETMLTFSPTSALTSVDLPTLGAPIRATKPQRVAAAIPFASSAFIFAADFAGKHRQRGALFRRALAAADALRGLQARQVDGNPELRVVMRPGALDLAINRSGQRPRLRPFLQRGLGVAHRPAVLVHPLGPVPLDEGGRRRIAAVEIDRADYGFADVAEDRLAPPPPR